MRKFKKRDGQRTTDSIQNVSTLNKEMQINGFDKDHWNGNTEQQEMEF